MFGTSRDLRTQPLPVEVDESPPTPLLTRQQLNARSARILERRLNTPSTFADRRREAQAVPPRDLVSLGVTEQVISQGMNSPEHTVLDVELFFDRQHPSRLFYQLPGGGMLPLTDTVGKEDKATRLRPMSSRPRLAGAFPEAPPDPPQRLV